MKIKKAVWGTDYDMHEDKCFDRPVCPDCKDPFGKTKDDDKYYCYSCGKEVTVEDPEMVKWLEDRSGTKIEMRDCFICGGEGTSRDVLVKNKVTLEWQTAWGECTKCGARFIV